MNASQTMFYCAFFSVAVNAQAERRYVNIHANGDGSGSSWSNAFVELQDALSVAGTGDDIWIAAGEYRPDFDGTIYTDDESASFVLKDNQMRVGGFAGHETGRGERDLVLNMTVLTGDIGVPGDPSDNTDTIVTAHGASPTRMYTFTLDGLTIASGTTYDPLALHRRGSCAGVGCLERMNTLSRRPVADHRVDHRSGKAPVVLVLLNRHTWCCVSLG